MWIFSHSHSIAHCYHSWNIPVLKPWPAACTSYAYIHLESAAIKGQHVTWTCCKMIISMNWAMIPQRFPLWSLYHVTAEDLVVVLKLFKCNKDKIIFIRTSVIKMIKRLRRWNEVILHSLLPDTGCHRLAVSLNSLQRPDVGFGAIFIIAKVSSS